MTPEEIDALERRSRVSARARAHTVTLEPCPACGALLAADLARAVKRGEQRCPTADRIRRVFRATIDAIVGCGS